MEDETERTIALPFAFPFAGTSYTTVTVSSNGFVWLGSVPFSFTFNPSSAAALAGNPRIMPCWWDLDGGFGGGVFYQADATQASIVWKGVPDFNSLTLQANYELVLHASGAFSFVYDASTSIPGFGDTCVVGYTLGGGATPNPRVWTTDLAGAALITGGTGLQEFPTGTFNLGGLTMDFLPSGSTGDFAVLSFTLGTCPPGPIAPLASDPQPIGVGCPAPNGAIYEFFDNNTGANPVDLANTSIEFVRNGDSYFTVPGPGLDPNYATNGTPMTMGDDTVINGLGVGPMGAFPFGSVAVTAVTACSNGYLWLDPTNSNTDYIPDTDFFRQQEARVAAVWTDLNFNPLVGGGGAGTWYWENTNPAFCQATWVGVREYFQPASSNTFQIRLRNNGNVVFSYGALSGAIAHNALAGISGGNAGVIGASDLVTGGIVNAESRQITGGATPIDLTLDGPGRLGFPVTMTSSVPPPLSGIGLFFIGAANPNVPLDVFGMTGCSLYSSLDLASFVVVFATSPMSQVVNIPPVPAFGGVTLYAQSAAFSTLNAGGIIASNGVAFTLGI